ncbi:hypothetical protein FO440_20685 [Mucilaginibacter corticis]|uniref:Uncharacterized protein n=1 Tax=Mucilaginibacter corticis TaxID=2597670 RepID=A0A556MG65_9SPHI|nr:hypothetical protein [Mucilaginibacter corticis]TSJ38917.1 hypothetical protein FO440_20685 [Mucilaginibacter corticis]
MTIRIPKTAYEKVLKAAVDTIPRNAIKITFVSYSYILEAEEVIMQSLYSAVNEKLKHLEQVKLTFDQKLDLSPA